MLQQDLHEDRGEAVRWGTGEVRLLCGEIAAGRGGGFGEGGEGATEVPVLVHCA